MRIIEAQDVDLIEPFPLNEITRLIGWTHCYKTITEADGGPQTDEEKAQYYQNVLPNILSWGIIDKNNSLGYKHEAPLIGMICVENANTPVNVYVHVASTRKAWGSGLVDQAGKTIIEELFNRFPQLARISAIVINSNKPAKNLAKRLGFKQDGLFQDFITQNNVPKAMAHFGYLRSYLSCQQHSFQLPSQPVEPPLVPQEKVESRAA